MKLKIKVELEWQTWDFDECLNLIVKFKYPNKLLPVTIKSKMFSIWQIDTTTCKLDENKPFKRRKEFEDAVLTYLTNIELIKEDVQKMVLEYYKKKSKKTESDKFEYKIGDLIKGLNENFEIDVEIEENNI